MILIIYIVLNVILIILMLKYCKIMKIKMMNKKLKKLKIWETKLLARYVTWLLASWSWYHLNISMAADRSLHIELTEIHFHLCLAHVTSQIVHHYYSTRRSLSCWQVDQISDNWRGDEINNLQLYFKCPLVFNNISKGFWTAVYHCCSYIIVHLP